MHSVAIVANYAYVIGGYICGECVTSVERFNIITEKW